MAALGSSGPNGQLATAAGSDKPPYFVGKAFGADSASTL